MGCLRDVVLVCDAICCQSVHLSIKFEHSPVHLKKLQCITLYKQVLIVQN